MRVGVTGHQDLGSPDDVAWVREQLRALVCDTSMTVGISALAVGADQLFAQILAEQHKPFVAVIPCRNYEETFVTPQDLERYHALLSQADEVVNLAYDQPSEEAFWEAGKWVVETSDSLVAVWNGLPAKGLGGTGDVVRYSLHRGKEVIQINPRLHRVEQLDAVAQLKWPL